MAEEIINKVALSALETIDLGSYFPGEEIVGLDLKPLLFMGMILKEKEFRASLQGMDWETYRDKIVAISCSADAIIPVWAYMLLASYLQPLAREIVLGDEKTAAQQILLKRLDAIDIQAYAGKRVVIKGCGEQPVGEFAYMEITRKLRPVARSIMYGEPCSTVPIFKARD
jgi:hypothetical protein